MLANSTKTLTELTLGRQGKLKTYIWSTLMQINQLSAKKYNTWLTYQTELH